MSKFIPIMFQTPLMQAHLEGRKNQTRRSAGLKKINEHPDRWSVDHNWTNPQTEKNLFAFMDKSGDNIEVIASPYGKPGDVLWFREKWTWEGDTKYTDALPIGQFYMAADFEENEGPTKWKPAIHMPAKACRMWGKITSIDIQRLYDINEQDAIDEGIEQQIRSILGTVVDKTSYKHYAFKAVYGEYPINSYITLFESINGTEFTQKNPWLWVVRYKVSHEAPIGYWEYVEELGKKNSPAKRKHPVQEAREQAGKEISRAKAVKIDLTEEQQ